VFFGNHLARHGGTFIEDRLSDCWVVESLALEVMLRRWVQSAPSGPRHPQGVSAHVTEPTMRQVYLCE
jgi:hypothetical protein